MKNAEVLVSVSLVVRNGEKFIRRCLDAVKGQTYGNVEVLVFDNDSSDKTLEIVREEYPDFKIHQSKTNYAVGGGQNRALKLVSGKYILALCVDVILDKFFIENAVSLMEKHPDWGALQAKIYSWDIKTGRKTRMIDTTGFEIFKSRRIINRGHGQMDKGQFQTIQEVFSFEGACPFFRRRALLESAIKGEVYDEDFFWYTDDIDLGWRMRLFGWKSVYAPSVIAYHDRQTTKRLSSGKLDFIQMRRRIPRLKRKLDMRNQYLMLVKNDILWLFLRHLPFFLWRQIQLLVYILLFEPFVFVSLPSFFRLLPRMIKKRRIIMKRKKVSIEEISRFFL